MKDIVRKLPAPAVFCLTVLVCCWWVIASVIFEIVNRWCGIPAAITNFTNSAVLCLVILELVGLAALFRGFGHTYAGLGAVVGNIGFGLIVGFIYWKWRRLWPLFIAHALFDLMLHFQTRAVA